MTDTYLLNIDRAIERWDEGIPLGNGETGAILYGNSNKLILSLDRGDIWDRSFRPEDTKGFNYKNFVDLAKRGKFRKIADIFDKPYYNPAPTKLPAGKIVFNIGNSKINSFKLDIKRAEAVYFGDNGLYFKTYMHYNDGIGRIITNASKIEFDILNPKFGKTKFFDKFIKNNGNMKKVSNRLRNLKYENPIIGELNTDAGRGKYFVQPIPDGSYFGIALLSKTMNAIQEFAYCVTLGNNCDNLIEEMKTKCFNALKIGYKFSFKSHCAHWVNYFDMSNIAIEDKELERLYNFTDYLLGSGSAKGCYPMPLQGLWTQNDGKTLPPWKGDYHHDLNTELTYSSYIKGNRLEQGLSFIDYLIALTGRAKEFAAKFYSAPGICLPSVMDIDGYALGGWPLYSLSPTNQLWLCQLIVRHYDYTGDKEFLEKIAYPYIQQSALFIASLLKKDNDGYYVLPISGSPEIHDNTAKSYLLPNSNYDEALLIYIFKTIKRFAKLLNIDDGNWDSYLNFLRPLAINEKNVLMLDNKETLAESHRHLSHLMSIYPLRLLDYANENDKLVIDNSIDYTVSLGSKFYTGYTFAWLACLYAVKKDGESTYKYLDIFRKYFCSINGFHLNGDYTKQGFSSLTYRPFSLEGNFCAASAVQEMLLYSEDGIIQIFPAIPKTWKNVSFKHLRGCLGILVSASMVDGDIEYVSIEAANNDVGINLRGNYVNYNSDYPVEYLKENVAIKLKKGETVTIKKVKFS